MADIETRDHTLAVGEVWPFVAPDATIVIEPVSAGGVRAWCLGAREHFDEAGACEHIDEICDLNPQAVVHLVPFGGPDYENERQIDLDWRRDRSGTVGE